MEVVLGHWDSWEDGSLIIDKKSGRFADPTKVKRLDHKGAFFKSRGPFTVPRSQQGHPVVIQAGASGRGQRFAGRWGEVIFTAARNLANAKQGYDAIKNEAAKAGRDPDQMFLCNLITPVCAATKAEAEDKMALIQKAAAGDRRAVAAGGGTELRLRRQGHRRAADHGRTAGHAGHARHPRRRAARPPARPIRARAISSPSPAAARPRTPSSAARRKSPTGWKRCSSAAAATALSIAATYVPGSYADFVHHIVPELQRRGLFHKDYAGKTLRENLGLRRPAAGAWKTQPRAAAE